MDLSQYSINDVIARVNQRLAAKGVTGPRAAQVRAAVLSKLANAGAGVGGPADPAIADHAAGEQERADLASLRVGIQSGGVAGPRGPMANVYQPVLNAVAQAGFANTPDTSDENSLLGDMGRGVMRGAHAAGPGNMMRAAGDILGMPALEHGGAALSGLSQAVVRNDPALRTKVGGGFVRDVLVAASESVPNLGLQMAAGSVSGPLGFAAFAAGPVFADTYAEGLQAHGDATRALEEAAGAAAVTAATSWAQGRFIKVGGAKAAPALVQGMAPFLKHAAKEYATRFGVGALGEALQNEAEEVGARYLREYVRGDQSAWDGWLEEMPLRAAAAGLAGGATDAGGLPETFTTSKQRRGSELAHRAYVAQREEQAARKKGDVVVAQAKRAEKLEFMRQAEEVLGIGQQKAPEAPAGTEGTTTEEMTDFEKEAAAKAAGEATKAPSAPNAPSKSVETNMAPGWDQNPVRHADTLDRTPDQLDAQAKQLTAQAMELTKAGRTEEAVAAWESVKRLDEARKAMSGPTTSAGPGDADDIGARLQRALSTETLKSMQRDAEAEAKRLEVNSDADAVLADPNADPLMRLLAMTLRTEDPAPRGGAPTALSAAGDAAGVQVSNRVLRGGQLADPTNTLGTPPLFDNQMDPRFASGTWPAVPATRADGGTRGAVQSINQQGRPAATNAPFPSGATGTNPDNLAAVKGINRTAPAHPAFPTGATGGGDAGTLAAIRGINAQGMTPAPGAVTAEPQTKEPSNGQVETQGWQAEGLLNQDPGAPTSADDSLPPAPVAGGSSFTPGGGLAKLGGKQMVIGDTTVDVIASPDDPKIGFITGLTGKDVAGKLDQIVAALRAEGFTDVQYRADAEDGRDKARIRLFEMLRARVVQSTKPAAVWTDDQSPDAGNKAPEPETQDKPAGYTRRPEREADIEKMVQAASKPMPDIVESVSLEGTNGNWYGPDGFPTGVKQTGKRRVDGYVYRSKDGSTYGTTYPTREAAAKAWKDKQAEESEDFRKAMHERTDEEFANARDYWIGKPEQGFQGELVDRAMSVFIDHVPERDKGKFSLTTLRTKTIPAILTAITTGQFNDMLRPDNSTSRKTFETLTGVKLPPSLSKTQEMFTGKPFDILPETKEDTKTKGDTKKDEPALGTDKNVGTRGSWEIVDGMIRVTFPSKPDTSILDRLKRAGFTWGGRKRPYWSAKATDITKEDANAAIGPSPAKKVGKNAKGQDVYEDGYGVRSYAEGGFLVTEAVSVNPGGFTGVNKSKRGPEYKTVEELAAENVDQQKKSEEDAARHRALVEIGQKEVPGIRLEDAADAGRMYSMLVNRQIGASAWNAYVADLYASGKAKKPDTDEGQGSAAQAAMLRKQITVLEETTIPGLLSSVLKGNVASMPPELATKRAIASRDDLDKKRAQLAKMEGAPSIESLESPGVAVQSYRPGDVVLVDGDTELSVVTQTHAHGALTVAKPSEWVKSNVNAGGRRITLKVNGANVRPIGRAGAMSDAQESPKAAQPPKADAAPKPAGVLSPEREARKKELEKRLRDKIQNRLQMGFDPVMLAEATELASIYIEEGARKFAAFARQMVGSLGDTVRPYLKSLYNGARDLPGMEEYADQMDPAAAVSKMTLKEIEDAILKEVAMANNANDSERSEPGERDGVRGGDGSTGSQSEDAAQDDGEAGDAGDAQSSPEAGGGVSVNDGKPAGTRGGRGGRGGSGTRKPRPGTKSGGEPTITGPRSEDQPVTPLRPERPKNVADRNHRIGPKDVIAPKGDEGKIQGNIAAIKLLQTLEKEGRNATPEEKKVLAQYVGWGATGVARALDSLKAKRVEEYHEAVETYNRQLQEWKDKRWPDYMKPTQPDSIKFEEALAWEKEYGDTYKQIRELVSAADFRDMQASTPFAHYTSSDVITRGIWGAVRRLGFKGGSVLETSAGVGHMLGLQPEDLANASQWTAVEMDSIPARILAKLYPEANVMASDFGTAKIAPASIDLIVGNVPFAANGPSWEGQPKGLSLHNAFLARSLRMLRPGGIMVAITSRSTMDESASDTFREWAATNSNLVGAIRLPEIAFQANAGTKVTTDILIFQKKKGPGNAVDWVQRKKIEVPNRRVKGKTANIDLNEYFHAHPEMMIGTLVADGLYPDSSELDSTMEYIKGSDWLKALDEAVQKLPENLAEEGSYAPKAETGEGEGTIDVDKSGVPYRVADGKRVSMAGKDTKLIPFFKDFVGLKRDALKLFDLQVSPTATDEEIESQRNKVRSQYRALVEKHGRLGTKFSDFRSDPAAFRVASLEKVNRKLSTSEKGGKSRFVYTEEYEDSDILTRRTQYPFIEPASADSIEDAVTISTVWKGTVDLDYMGALLKKSPEQVRKDLLDKAMVFVDPDSGLLVSRDEYLSGNVKEKLQKAEDAAKADPAYSTNVDSLKSVQPERKDITKVSAMLGASWVPSQAYEDFAKETLDASTSPITVVYSETVHAHQAAVNSRWNPDAADVAMGAAGVPLSEIIAKTINFERMTVVVEGDTPGSTRQDPVATAAVRYKQEQMQEKWMRWMKGSDWALRLEDAYNDKVNTSVARKYTPPAITNLPGSDPRVTLRPHQLRDISRGLGNSHLNAHEVGTGKTYIIIATAMEHRRLGLARKPMIVVQNSTVGAYARAFANLYPSARVLVPSDADFETKRRKRTLQSIASNDWDAVIIPQSQLEKIRNDPEREREYVAKMVDELEDAIIAEGVRDVEKARFSRDPKVKALARRLKAVKDLAKKLLDGKRDTEVASFEELGVDALLVDEAHAYKKLAFVTVLPDIKGMDTGFSKRGLNMLLKTLFVQANRGGKNVHFYTGTPITNTLAEAWTMMRYLRPDVLAAAHITSFDEFVATFAKRTTEYEMQGGIMLKAVERLRAFNNVSTLQQLWLQVADEQTADAAGIPRPPIEGGGREVRTIPSTRLLTSLMRHLLQRYRAFENMSPKDRYLNKHIPGQINAAARAAAVDIRLINHTLPDDPGSKLNAIAKEMHSIWKETTPFSGAQVLFLDRYRGLVSEPTGEYEIDDETGVATPKYRRVEKFNAFHEMKRKLVRLGIPEDEIAIVTDPEYDDTASREPLFDAVRQGKVRIVLASSERAGVGVNMQERLVALHHGDGPFTAAMMDQREGRIQRQGNETWELSGQKFKPRIIGWAVTGSYDSGQYERLARKAKIQWQFRLGENVGETIEDDEDVISYAQAAATITGNPLFKQRAELEDKIRALKSDMDEFFSGQNYLQRRINEKEQEAKEMQRRANEARLENEQYYQPYKDSPKVRVNFDPAVTTEEDINAAIKEYLDSARTKAEEEFLHQYTTSKKPSMTMSWTLAPIIANGKSLALTVTAHKDVDKETPTIWFQLAGEPSSKTHVGIVNALDRAMSMDLNNGFIAEKEAAAAKYLQEAEEMRRKRKTKYENADELENAQEMLRAIVAKLAEQGNDASTRPEDEHDDWSEIGIADPVKSDDDHGATDGDAEPTADASDSVPESQKWYISHNGKFIETGSAVPVNFRMDGLDPSIEFFTIRGRGKDAVDTLYEASTGLGVTTYTGSPFDALENVINAVGLERFNARIKAARSENGITPRFKAQSDGGERLSPSGKKRTPREITDKASTMDAADAKLARLSTGTTMRAAEPANDLDREYDRFLKRLGLNPVWFTSRDEGLEGVVSRKDKNVYLRAGMDTDRAMAVPLHELLHKMRDLNPELFELLKKAAGPARIDAAIAAYRARLVAFAGPKSDFVRDFDASRDRQIEEGVATVLESMATDPEIRAAILAKPNIWARFKRWAKALLDKFGFGDGKSALRGAMLKAFDQMEKGGGPAPRGNGRTRRSPSGDNTVYRDSLGFERKAERSQARADKWGDEGRFVYEDDKGDRYESWSDPYSARAEEGYRELVKVMSLPITDAMRESVMGEGQLLFSVAPPTDSAAFKAWFGKSKMIDGDGLPRVMYHQTAADFQVFHPGGTNPRMSGRAIWLTPFKERQEAAHNTMEARGSSLSYKDGTNVIPVYVKMERPLWITDLDEAQEAESKFQLDSFGFPRTLTDASIAAIRKAGHDGIYFADPRSGDPVNIETGEGVEVIVFDPAQVKSATGNHGTYDPANPDIRMSPAPAPAEESTPLPERRYLDAALVAATKAVRGAARRGKRLADVVEAYAAQLEKQSGHSVDRAILTKITKAWLRNLPTVTKDAMEQLESRYATATKEADEPATKKEARERRKATSEAISEAVATLTAKPDRNVSERAALAGKLAGMERTADQIGSDAVRAMRKAHRQGKQVGAAAARAQGALALNRALDALRMERTAHRMAQRSADAEGKVRNKLEYEGKIKAAVLRIADEMPMRIKGTLIPAIKSAKNVKHIVRAINRAKFEIARMGSRDDMRIIARLAKKWGRTLNDTNRLKANQAMTAAVAAYKALRDIRVPDIKGFSTLVGDPATDAAETHATTISQALAAMKQAVNDQRIEDANVQITRKLGTDDVRRDLMAGLDKQKELPRADVPSANNPGAVRNFLRKYWNVRTLMMKIDGKADTGAAMALFQRMKRAQRKHLADKHQFEDAAERITRAQGYSSLAQFMAEVSGTLGTQGQTVVQARLNVYDTKAKTWGTRKVQITLGQALYILASDPQTQHWAHRGTEFVFDDGKTTRFKIPDRTWGELERAVPVRALRAMKALKKEYDRQYFNGLNDVSKTLNGRYLDKVQDYWGVRRYRADDELDGSKAMRDAIPALEAAGILQDRSGGRDPIIVGDFGTEIFRRSEAASHIVHKAKEVHILRATLLSRPVLEKIARVYGDKIRDRLVATVQEFAGKRIESDSLGKIISNINRSKVQLWVPTWLRNMGSIARLMSVMPMTDIAAGFAQWAKSPVETYRTLLKHSPELRERWNGSAGTMSFAMPGATTATHAGARKALTATMKQLVATLEPLLRLNFPEFRRRLASVDKPWTEMLDSLSIGNVFDSAAAGVAFHASKRRGMSDRVAAMAATEMFERVANTNTVLESTGLQQEAKASLWRAMLMSFTSDIAKAQNLIIQARMRSPRDLGKTLAGILLSIAFSASVTYAFNRLRGDEADTTLEATQKRLMKDLVSLAPLGNTLGGPVVERMMSGTWAYGRSAIETPIQGTATTLVEAGHKAYQAFQALSDDDTYDASDKALAALKSAASATGDVIGLPVGGYLGLAEKAIKNYE